MYADSARPSFCLFASSKYASDDDIKAKTVETCASESHGHLP